MSRYAIDRVEEGYYLVRERLSGGACDVCHLLHDRLYRYTWWPENENLDGVKLAVKLESERRLCGMKCFDRSVDWRVRR